MCIASRLYITIAAATRLRQHVIYPCDNLGHDDDALTQAFARYRVDLERIVKDKKCEEYMDALLQ